ncbi:MAG: DnaD domain-containing protein [Nitrospiraceae bacterium]
MSTFSGFPAGTTRLTAIPNPFFSELLPSIDHLAELKVTLYSFWFLSRAEGDFPYLSREELAQDSLLMEGLSGGLETLDDALERCVSRGTMLKATLEMGGDSQSFYFLNGPNGRAAVAAIEAGEWRPSGDSEAPLELRLERPNIFNLYEKNIGPLTPMIADRLRDAEQTYPEDWIVDAIRIAVENNVRKWRYVEAILEDWMETGKHGREDRGDTERARRRYRQGQFADFWDA